MYSLPLLGDDVHCPHAQFLLRLSNVQATGVVCCVRVRACVRVCVCVCVYVCV